MSERKTSARQEMIGIVEGLRAELASIYQALGPENYTKVQAINKQMDEVSNEISELRKRMSPSGFTPEGSTLHDVLERKRYALYQERRPFLEGLDIEVQWDRFGLEEQVRDKEEYLIVTDDELMERERAWDQSPERVKCPLLVDEIPGPTRFERGLEELPCKYRKCLEWGKCWASIPGATEPGTMHLGRNVFGDREAKNAEYGLYPDKFFTGN